MSRNFELLQQAGSAWEVPPPVVKEPKPFIPIPLGHKRRKAKPAPARAYPSMDRFAGDEALRLAQRIFLQQAEEPPKVVVFAGIDHGNGCSRICVDTAAALRTYHLGSVCIVEGNFRTPSLPDLFGTTNHCGLTNALLSGEPIRSFAKPVQTEGLWLLSAGALAPDSHGLLNSSRLRVRFDELRREFDYILVDAPPLTRYPDAIALSRAADGLVMVLEAHSTRRDVARKVTENLRATQVQVLGVVLNKRTFPIPETLYRSL